MVLELNLSNRGEIFRLKAWSNGRCYCLLRGQCTGPDSEPVCLSENITLRRNTPGVHGSVCGQQMF